MLILRRVCYSYFAEWETEAEVFSELPTVMGLSGRTETWNIHKNPSLGEVGGLGPYT